MSYPTSSIQVTNAIGLTGSGDTFPTHYSNFGVGGVHSVLTITERDAITTPRRAWGMLVVVSADGANSGIYILANTILGGTDNTITNNANFIRLTTGGGTLTGSGAATQVAYWSGTSVLTGEAAFTYDATNNILKADRFNTTLSSAPGSGVTNGDFYYNSTLLDFQGRINGQWANITRAGTKNITSADSPYTLIESERNYIIYADTTTADIIINIDVVLSTNYTITILNTGTHTVTFSNGASTYHGITNTINIRYAAANLVYKGSNTWYGLGALGAGGGVTITDGSGTTAAGSSVNLGGIVTSNIAIDDPTHTYNFWIGATDAPATIFLAANGDLKIVSIAGESWFHNGGAGTGLTLNEGLSKHTFNDNSYGAGLEYGADYITNYNDRTLTDWGNVKAAKTYTGKQIFAAATSTLSSIQVGSFTANPSTPQNGDMYYNSTANELRARINGTWIALGAGGGGGGITNSGVNNEIVKSDGTNVVGTKIFSTTNGNIVLGDSGLSGNRSISITTSDTNAWLTLTGKGTNGVRINNLFMIGNISEYTDPNYQNHTIYIDVTSGLYSIIGGNSTISILSNFNIKAASGVDGTNLNGVALNLYGGDAYNTSGNGNGGNILIQSGLRRTAGSGLDGNITLNCLAGKIYYTQAPTDSTDTSDHILIRDTTDGELKKLGFGTGITITSGSIAQNFNADVYYYEMEDFLGGSSALSGTASGWVSTVSGASSISHSSSSPVSVATTENFFGIIQVSAGTGTTDSARLHKGSTSVLFGLGHTITARSRAGIDVLSDGTTTYIAYIGFGDVSTGNDTDAVCFRYTHSVNSGNWIAVCRSNGTETTSNFSVGPTAGVMDIFEITINSAGTSVDFSINGGTVVTITTNIPTGSGRQLGPNFRMTKSAGGSARTMIVDWASFLVTRTSAR